MKNLIFACVTMMSIASLSADAPREQQLAQYQQELNIAQQAYNNALSNTATPAATLEELKKKVDELEAKVDALK